jgi:pimeloyl-ACP methyl ester carboxylesterase
MAASFPEIAYSNTHSASTTACEPDRMLEVIDKGAVSDAHPVPLLFVHGSWHGAWCWDEYFLGFFADRGYRALAVNVRGHGNSPTPKSLRWCSIADYVSDVVSVASGLPAGPVVIGHSLGGFVVQKYLESNDAPAGVLLASMPPRGALPFTLRLTRRLPWLTAKAIFTGDSLSCVDTAELAHAAFFAPQTPRDDVVRHAVRLQQESQRTGFDGMFLNLPRPKRVTAPMLVLGGELDRCFTQKEVRATARAYGTEAEILPGMAHDMMLEPDWAAVAQRIDSWLGGRGL